VDYESWESVSSLCDGYHSQVIIDKVANATRMVVTGKALYERDGCVFNDQNIRWELISSLLWSANHNNKNLDIIDYGGSLGSLYYQHRRLLSGYVDLKWGIVEQKNYVEIGNKEFSNKNLSFYNSIEECMSNQSPNVLILSSVLAYLKDPYITLCELLKYNISSVIIDRTMLIDGKDRLTIQEVPPQIFKASLPAWILSRKKIISLFESYSYEIMANWKTDDMVPLDGCDIKAEGIWFKNKQTK